MSVSTFGAVRIHGRLQIDCPDPDGFLREPDSLYTNQTFQILLNDWNSWRIELHSPNAPRVITTLAYDGHDCLYYKVTHGTADPRYPNFGDTNSVSYISSGPIPYSSFYPGDGRNTLWFAFFAAANVPLRELEVMPVLWFNPRVSLNAYGFTNRVSLVLHNTSTLIEAAAFARCPSADLAFSDELARPTFDEPQSPAAMDNARKILQFRQLGWKEGDEAVVYHLNSSTNIAGFTLPLAFMLTLQRNPATHSPIVRHTGQVVRVETDVASEPPFPPVLEPTRVADSRFRGRTRSTVLAELAYALQPGAAWPRGDDAKLRQIASQELANQPRLGYGRPMIIRGMFLLAFLIIVLLIPYRVMKARRRGSSVR